MSPSPKRNKVKSKAKATKKSAKRDPMVIRRKILEDPNTAKIAEKLKIPIEKYVAQVMHYAMNPKAEPTLLVVSDDNLRSLGYEPPDQDAMAQYINEAVAITTVAKGSGYSAPKKQLVAMPDGPGGRANPSGSGSKELDEEVTARPRGPSSKG